jgi:gliding motility-associated lipoprotein GldJ
LGDRPVKLEDGILLPKYRLPTEAEWEFAALGLIGNLDPDSENINSRRVYPWDGHYVRRNEDQWQGAIQANFVRSKGDYMGVSGALNDGADVTARVDDFWPNDYGLYHMAGNVSEWVMDVYRPTTGEVSSDFMPFRGNVYTTQLLRPDGLHDKPVQAQDNLYDVYGMKEYVNEFARAKYLSLVGGKDGKKISTSNLEYNDPSYISNYMDEDNKYINFLMASEKTQMKLNGVELLVVDEKLTLNKDKVDEIVKDWEWELPTSNVTVVSGGKPNNDDAVLQFTAKGDYEVKMTQKKWLSV